jgi:hypothetical protein
VVVHGWVYGLHNGLLEDLKITASADQTWAGPTALALVKQPTQHAARCPGGAPQRALTDKLTPCPGCPMFPHRLTDQPRLRHRAGAAGRLQPPLPAVPRHQRAAKQRFEQADWHGQQRAQRERIEFYDKRVNEAVERLQTEFKAAACRWTPGSRSSCTTSAC